MQESLPIVPSRWLSSRTLLGVVLLGAVAWAFAWGAHEHGSPVLGADLASVEPDQRFVVDASTATLDLAAVAVQPGQVVEFTLAGSANAPHSFVLTGAGGAEMDTLTDAAGDTVIRIRVPQSGQVAFLCTIPGHEGLHGNLVVTSEGGRS